MKWLKFLLNKLKPKRKANIYNIEDLDISEREQFIKELKFSLDLETNLKQLKNLFGNSVDLNIRKFKAGEKKIPGAIVYLAGMVDKRAIEQILKSLETDLLQIESLKNNKDIYKIAFDQLLTVKSVKDTNIISKMLKEVTMGMTAIMFDGIPRAILCDTKGFEIRNIKEPDAEISLLGPRDGFVENIFVNISQIRRRIRGPHLWFEEFKIGSISNTTVALGYIKGLASEELVEEVKSRLRKVDVDNMLESGILQEYLRDTPFSFFPIINRTERPDIVASCLAEGKVVILVDNTPFVLIIPTTFNMLLQTPDDYYATFPIGSFIRILRHIAFWVSLLLPGTYVAVVNFHHELLPLELLLKIIGTREGVPFPIIYEALLMEGLFELLREAGIRLPRAIGQSISIVGALILGEAAIAAGLVSPAMVIIVAITAIASFSIPSYHLGTAARFYRFSFILLGGTFGLFGIQFGLLILLISLCSLRSFGQPYMQPYAPLVLSDLKDSVVRIFHWKITTRPKLIGGREPQRQKKGQKPKPPKTK